MKIQEPMIRTSHWHLLSTPKTYLVISFLYIGKDCSNRNSTPQKINQELPNWRFSNYARRRNQRQESTWNSRGNRSSRIPCICAPKKTIKYGIQKRKMQNGKWQQWIFNSSKDCEIMSCEESKKFVYTCRYPQYRGSQPYADFGTWKKTR